MTGGGRAAEYVKGVYEGTTLYHLLIKVWPGCRIQNYAFQGIQATGTAANAGQTQLSLFLSSFISCGWMRP